MENKYIPMDHSLDAIKYFMPHANKLADDMNKIIETHEREIMREHIVWLSTQLENERNHNKEKIELMQRMLDPEDLGHAVSNEVRKLIYVILINDTHKERSEWKSN
jgi:hypothetical protein